MRQHLKIPNKNANFYFDYSSKKRETNQTDWGKWAKWQTNLEIFPIVCHSNQLKNIKNE